MAVRNKTQLATLYGTSGSEFPDNTTEQITEAKLRAQGEDLKDSMFNLVDDVYTGAKGLKNNINTITNLKAVVTLPLTVPLYTVFRDTDNGNVLRVYELVSGTDAEASPTIIRPNDYAGTTNEKVWKLCTSPDAAIIGSYKVSGVISSADILNSFTSPVTLVPAPGTGLILVPSVFFFWLDYNSSAYATNTTFRLEMNGLAVSIDNPDLLLATSDSWAHMYPIATTSIATSIINQALTFQVQSGNPTGGDSPIRYTVIYSILSTI